MSEQPKSVIERVQEVIASFKPSEGTPFTTELATNICSKIKEVDPSITAFVCTAIPGFIHVEQLGGTAKDGCKE